MAALLVLVVAAIGVVACGAATSETTGIVVEVEGDLTTVSSFVVVDESGKRLVFVPSREILFHDRAPITHVRDHLRTGEPVTVVYEELDDGSLLVLEVFDASA